MKIRRSSLPAQGSRLGLFLFYYKGKSITFVFTCQAPIDFSEEIVYTVCVVTYMDNTPDRLNEQARELQKIAREMRRKEFQKLKSEGLTLQAIADKYGITKQRVKQILDGKGKRI